MGYCGTCGGFENPDCGQRKNGGFCQPAPNPHDEAHAEKLARVACANAEVAGMIADNEFARSRALSPKHLRKAFQDVLLRYGLAEVPK